MRTPAVGGVITDGAETCSGGGEPIRCRVIGRSGRQHETLVVGRFIAGVLVTLVVLAVIGLLVVYTGSYDVAASQPHTAFGRWVLDTAFDNSVGRHSKGIRAPTFTPAMVADGAGEFKQTCQHCHGGPGVKPDAWTQGLLPGPPDLAQSTTDMSAAEVFWVIKHGVKMTAMPSFAASGADDQKIWNITAFVKALPKMSPAQYASYQAEKEKDQASGG